MIEDWYDNGKIDRSWNCECLLDGLTLLPGVSQSGHVSMRDELERQVRAQCVNWSVPVNDSEVTARGSEMAASEAEIATLYPTLTEFHPADTDTGDIYSVPWAIVVAGIVSGCLVVLIGAAAVRQWPLRAFGLGALRQRRLRR